VSVRFEGYAAVFDQADRGGDVVRRGAFGTVAAVPLLWQHRGAPVGAIDTVEEDAIGLRVAGHVTAPALARLVAAGAVAGLSIGYRALDTRQGVRRELRRVALIEVSLVARPMQPLARVTAVASE
jgi:uncharacterized protein